MYFKNRLKTAFDKNKQINDQEEIKKLIGRGEFVIKEVEALYKLKKYRYLKHNYYDNDGLEKDSEYQKKLMEILQKSQQAENDLKKL